MSNFNPIKAQKARQAKKESWNPVIIPVIEGWVVYQFDEMNWSIKSPKGKANYFGSLESALRALPRRILNEEPGDIKSVLNKLDSIQSSINRMVIAAKFLQ